MSLSVQESRFAADWLALREPADAQARSTRLTEQAAAWLERADDRVIVDLGSGAGSNPRYLAPRLPGPQQWRLVDHDSLLLARAVERLQALASSEGTLVEISTWPHDLDRLEADWWEGAHLVTASALFDLVSREWLERLVDGCARRGIALLATLSVTGHWHFIDRDGRLADTEEDAWVAELLRVHQRRDKGLGVALGGEAPEEIERLFTLYGYRVERDPSPWQLSAGTSHGLSLGSALLDGWFDAACELAPQASEALGAWHAQRRSALASGALGLWVEHCDLFARPAQGNAE